MKLPSNCRGACGRLLHFAGNVAARLYGWALLDADVEWTALLPRGAKIYAGNHPTTTDALLAMGLPGPHHLLITERVLKIPVLGWYLRAAGHLPVWDGHRLATYACARRVLRAGRSVVMAPEGDLSPAEGGLGRLQPGFAHLAFETGAPVVPIGVAVQRERIWSVNTTVAAKTTVSRYYFRGRYCVTIGEALWLEGSIDDHVRMRAAREQLFERLTALTRRSEERLTAASSRKR